VREYHPVNPDHPENPVQTVYRIYKIEQDYQDHNLGMFSFGSTVIERKRDMRTIPGAAPFGLDKNFRSV
jgi:hypothetical protein